MKACLRFVIEFWKMEGLDDIEYVLWIRFLIVPSLYFCGPIWNKIWTGYCTIRRILARRFFDTLQAKGNKETSTFEKQSTDTEYS